MAHNHLTGNPQYQNEFIDPRIRIDEHGQRAQREFEQHIEERRRRQQVRNQAEINRRRQMLRSDPNELMNRELFIRDNILEDEQAFRSYLLNANPELQGANRKRGPKKSKGSILPEGMKSLQEQLGTERVIPLFRDTDQAEISGKEFIFRLETPLLNVRKILIERVQIKGFDYATYTNDLQVFCEFTGFSSYNDTNYIPDVTANHLQHRFAFRLPTYVDTAGNALDTSTVHYDDFNSPMQINSVPINRLTQLRMRFFRRNGSDMFTTHYLEMNPVKYSLGTELQKIIITSGNDAVDFTESGTEYNARVPNGVYKRIGSNVLEIDEGSGEQFVLIPGNEAGYGAVDLAKKIASELNRTGNGLNHLYTCTFDSSTNKFTIGANNNFSILWNTGFSATNNSTNPSIGSVIGFDLTGDDTGTNSYTADNAVSDPLKIVVDQHLPMHVAKAMNDVGTNTYAHHMTGGGLFKMTKTSGVNFGLNFNSGTNSNYKIAETIGYTTNKNVDIAAAADQTSDIVPPDEVDPQTGSFNQMPNFRMIIYGKFILGPAEESGI